MPMELDRRELKAQARARMRASEPPFWLVTLVFLLLTTGVSTAADLSGAAYIALPPAGGDTLPVFLSLRILLDTTVMNFGYRLWALKLFRQQNPGFNTLIDGFSIAGRILVMEAFVLLCTLGWTFLYSIPVTLVFLLFAFWAPPMVQVLLSYLAGLLLALIISYRYVLAPYLLMDHPEWGPFVAVRESVSLMRGWKWEFFKLDLSFLGWYALRLLLSFGVELLFALPVFLELLQSPTADFTLLISGLELPWLAALLSVLIQIPVSLWLLPYANVSYAGFYQARTAQQAPPVWDTCSGPEF